MAPIAVSSPPIPAAPSKISLASFADGLVTSGQHAPVFELLRPYSEFPKAIDTPKTLWTGKEMQSTAENWCYPFSPAEIEELGKAADLFIEANLPLVEITKQRFLLPTLEDTFARMRPELLDGRGFILFRNIPVNQWSNLKCAVAYLGLGTHFGRYTSQNRLGHILGHVQNLSEDASKSKDPIRIYRTNKRQFFHTDGADLVGLLCMARAMEGGESDISSTHMIWNVLQERYPDVAETLTRSIWYADRKGEMSEGELPYYKTALFFLENETDPATRRVYARFDPMNFTTLSRFNSGPNPEIPPLSAAQLYAMEKFEEVAHELSLHMILEPGDIQVLSNLQVFHARTEYTDWPLDAVDDQGTLRKQRQLMRLWLATSDKEGGWKTCFPDSAYPRRGGIQVNDQPPVCPLGAE